MVKTAERMAEYRARQRARGLRPMGMWVYDTSSPEFQERLRRSAELLRDHPSTREGDAFCEAALEEIAREIDASEERGRATQR
jgi:hypothetical protein